MNASLAHRQPAPQNPVVLTRLLSLSILSAYQTLPFMLYCQDTTSSIPALISTSSRNERIARTFSPFFPQGLSCNLTVLTTSADFFAALCKISHFQANVQANIFSRGKRSAKYSNRLYRLFYANRIGREIAMQNSECVFGTLLACIDKWGEKSEIFSGVKGLLGRY